MSQASRMRDPSEAEPRCTSAQIGMMRNALGLLWAKKPYRNHFCLTPGPSGGKYDAWLDLVEQGLAVIHPPTPKTTSTMRVFSVTAAGYRFLGLEPNEDAS